MVGVVFEDLRLEPTKFLNRWFIDDMNETCAERGGGGERRGVDEELVVVEVEEEEKRWLGPQ